MRCRHMCLPVRTPPPVPMRLHQMIQPAVLDIWWQLHYVADTICSYVLSEVVNGLLLPTLAALCRKVPLGRASSRRMDTTFDLCSRHSKASPFSNHIALLQWNIPGHVAGAGILALGNCLPNTVTRTGIKPCSGPSSSDSISCLSRSYHQSLFSTMHRPLACRPF
jgi:hypothetical protein